MRAHHGFSPEYVFGGRGTEQQDWLMACSGCWASTNYSIQGCGSLEQQLRACMDGPVSLLESGHSHTLRPFTDALAFRRKSRRRRKRMSTRRWSASIPRYGRRRSPITIYNAIVECSRGTCIIFKSELNAGVYIGWHFQAF
jgi:hypothetical protein